MESLIVIILILIAVIALFSIMGTSAKKIKKMAENDYLNKLTDKYPENIDICKSILKMLKNERVTIEEDKESETSLYIALTNKIIIANLKNNFTRIQTIAHECIHSVQDRKVLLFNFIYSNIYLLYFIIVSGLTLFNKVQNTGLQISVLILMGFVFYVIRAYLENDAMTKARFLAKEYMQNNKYITDEQIDEVINEYDRLNSYGIKLTDFSLFWSVVVKVLIYAVIAMI